MTDFLTNLAARSVGAAAVIRPRLPSLFEPLADETVTAPEPANATPAEKHLDPSIATTSPIIHREQWQPAAPAHGAEQSPIQLASSIHVIQPELRRTHPSEKQMPAANIPSLTKRRETTVSPAYSLQPAIPKQILPQPVKSRTATAIHVTIGRIEVRAVQQSERAAPPAKSKKPQPRLTLDDYLVQRRQGKL